MKRHNYCGHCEGMVRDNDVTCRSCGKRYCAYCITPYDAITRVAVIHARVGLLRPTITEEEMNTYLEDLETISKDENYLGYLRHLDWPDEIPEFVRTMKQFPDLLQKQALLYVPNGDYFLNENLESVAEFVNELVVCEWCQEEKAKSESWRQMHASREEIDNIHKNEITLLNTKIEELKNKCEMLEAHLNMVLKEGTSFMQDGQVLKDGTSFI